MVWKINTFKNLNRIYTPKGGEIVVESVDINMIKAKELAKKIALVPQNTHY